MPDSKSTLPLEEIILGIALEQGDTEPHVVPHILEDVWTTQAESPEEIGEPKWLEDMQGEPEQCAREPRMTRRELFGLRDGTSESPQSPERRKRRLYTRLAGVSSVCLLGVGLYAIVGDDDAALRTVEGISSTTSALAVETTSVPTTIILPAPELVLPGIPTLPPETTVLETLPPTTLPPETVPATSPPETAPPTTPAPEPAPTTLPLYGVVNCEADSVVIQRGMTFSGLAEYCGLRTETLQSYNPSFHPETDFITGRTIRLQPGASGASSSLAKECPSWFGAKKLIASGFRVIDYLQNDMGISSGETSRLVYSTTMIDDYDLDVVTAGTYECVPTLSALQVRYGAKV